MHFRDPENIESFWKKEKKNLECTYACIGNCFILKGTFFPVAQEALWAIDKQIEPLDKYVNESVLLNSSLSNEIERNCRKKSLTNLKRSGNPSPVTRWSKRPERSLCTFSKTQYWNR